MNKLILLFIGSCFLASCASSSAIISPVVLHNDSNVILNYRSNTPILTMEQKAVSLLNQIFNTNPTNNKMILVINNYSDCDFTMDIIGENHYKIPVAAKKTESIVVQRGQYHLVSQVCQTQYSSVKTLTENTELDIKHTLIKVPADKETIASATIN